MSTGALKGLRVLECAHFIAGPRCAQILADHGAEVVKLEPPGGDLSRRSAPYRHGWSLYFAAHNHGKKSIVVNLKDSDGQRVLRRLIEWAEVVITNYTPGATERLGLDFESASQINPSVVVVRISAYGAAGSGRDLPGFDGNIQARSGLAHMVGPADRPPTITSVPVIDYLAALEGVVGALLGLRHRDVTGKGVELDISMLDATATVLGYLYAEVLVSGHEPMRTGSRAPYAFTGAYEASDGYVYIAPIGAPAWRALCDLVGRPEWSEPGAAYLDTDARLRDRNLIESVVNSWTRRHTRDRLVEMFGSAGVACGRVNSVAEVAVDPLLSERAMIKNVALGSSGETVPMPGVEVKLGGFPDVDDCPITPELGAHTHDVLIALGFSEVEVKKLRDTAVVA